MVNVLNKITTKKDNITTTYKIGDLIEGYYNSSTGKFYEESTYTTEIEGAPGFIYVDLTGNNIYIYRTDTSSFVKVSGIEEDNFKFGYLNKTNGKFYEDNTYQVEIPPNSNNIYIGLDDNTIYRYDSVNTEYVNVLGSAASKNYTDVVRPGNYDLVESNAVYSAINNAVSSIYTPRGELACAQLTSSLLIPANVGSVYEMSDSGTTSALFLQGAGTAINVGDNVGIIKAGENTYLFNLMGNAFDLTDYQKKELTTPLNIGGVSKTTVEDALGALNNVKADQAEVDDISNIYGAKNLIPYPYDIAAHMEYDGVVWDTIEEGTVTVTGQLQTANTTTYHVMARSNSGFRKSGTYILTGCPAGGSSTTYRMQAGYADSGGTWHNLAVEYGDGVTFTYDYDTAQADLAIRCQILSASYVANNLTFHPMLRLATIKDNTYVPYAKTNKQLTDNVKGIQDNINQLGAKNLIPYPYNSTDGVYNAVTYSSDKNGVITVSGTAGTNNANFYLTDWRGHNLYIEAGKTYRLTGCPSGGSIETYCLALWTFNDDGTELSPTQRYYETGNGLTFTPKVSGVIRLYFRVASGKTAPSDKVYPMLRLATDPDDTWVPYAEGNRELTNKLRDTINLFGAKNIIKYPYIDYIFGPVISKGQTFTANDDNSITVTGTSTDATHSSYFVLNRRIFIKAGTYTLSAGSAKHAGMIIILYADKQGNPYTGTYSGLNKSSDIVYTYTTQNGNDFTTSNLYGYDKTFTIDEDCYINIEARGTVSSYTSSVNETIYPMLKSANITDNTYVPPGAKTNNELVQNMVERVYGDNSYNQETIPTYGGGVRYIRRASVVTVVVENVGNTQNIAKGGYVQLGVELPSEYRPYPVSITGFGTASNSIGSGLMEFLIGSDGKMYVRSSEANITHGRAYATYVVV